MRKGTFHIDLDELWDNPDDLLSQCTIKLFCITLGYWAAYKRFLEVANFWFPLKFWKKLHILRIKIIILKSFNSQAVGWDSWIPSALKSIFLGDLIFESAAWFFVIILKSIFTPIFEIIINETNQWNQKISFSKADFY